MPLIFSHPVLLFSHAEKLFLLLVMMILEHTQLLDFFFLSVDSNQVLQGPHLELAVSGFVPCLGLLVLLCSIDLHCGNGVGAVFNGASL